MLRHAYCTAPLSCRYRYVPVLSIRSGLSFQPVGKAAANVGKNRCTLPLPGTTEVVHPNRQMRNEPKGKKFTGATAEMRRRPSRGVPGVRSMFAEKQADEQSQCDDDENEGVHPL